MYWDNQVVIYIASNFTFHEHKKHIEIDWNYIRDKVMSRVISAPYMASSHQLVDIFTKSLAKMENYFET